MFLVTEIGAINPTTTEALALGVTITRKGGMAAKIERFSDGVTFRVSKLDGETVWHVDGIWEKGCSFPKFWNGEGSRCTAPWIAPIDVATHLDGMIVGDIK